MKGAANAENGAELMDTRSRVSALSFRPDISKNANGPTAEHGLSDSARDSERTNDQSRVAGLEPCAGAKSGSFD